MADHEMIASGVAGMAMSRQFVLAALREGLTAENLVFQLPPSRTHILWTIGHLAWSRDRFLNGTLGATPVLPDSYGELFTFQTEPVADASAYPPLDEVLAQYQAAHEAGVARLGDMKDSDLARELPEESPIREVFPTVGALLGGTPFHEGYHAGQITLLRRAQGLEAGFGM